MKNFTLFNKITIVLGILIFQLSLSSYAQVKQKFLPRYDTTIRGNFSVIANNVLSRTATGNYNGTSGNHDFSDNVYVDIDTDPSTFNSSSANFSNPEPTLSCVTVRKAYLYWAAADKEKDDGSDNQPSWNYNEVKLMLPGQSNYSTIVADQVIFRGRDTHFSNDPFVCVKDISSLVTVLSNPYGKYQVANIEAKTGNLMAHDGGNTGTSGGWQIVFVYESPLLTAKNVTIFDGYAHVTKTTNNFDITFSGFKTITSGPVKADVVMGALEGDRDLSGDMLQIKNVAGSWVSLSTPLRPVDNFFNSKITSNGADFVTRNPASLNTLGFDSAMFPLDNSGNALIKNDQKDATIRLTSNHETYGLYLIGLSVDVWEPSIKPLELTLNTTATSHLPGDIIPIKFELKNSGNDDVVNLKINGTLPDQLSLKTPLTLPAGVSYTYNASTKFLEFTFVDGLLNIGSPGFDVNFNLQVANECYFLTNNCNLTIPLQVTGIYNGTINTNTQNTLSSSSINACEVGDELPTIITITQPVANWKTLPNVLNRTIECGDTVALAAAQSLVPETDKCTFTINKTSGAFVPNACGGTYTNTFVFTDACGVTSSPYVQTITVVDTTPPSGTAPADISGLECVSDVPVANIAAVTDEADNCGGTVTVTVSDTNNGGLGTTVSPYIVTRVYRLTDECGYYTDLSQKITVIDNINPTITCAAPVSVNVDANACSTDASNVTLGTPTTYDNCSVATVTNDAPASFLIGDTAVTWTVTDGSGNTATCTQIVTVTDNIPPVFVEALPEDATFECNNVPEAATLTATDNCGTTEVTFSEERKNGSCDSNFTLERIWTATDNTGLSITHTQAITVQDNTAPELTTNLDTELNVSCSNIPEIPTLEFTDDCSANVTVVYNETNSFDADNLTDYEIIRTWTVSDLCGNEDAYTQKINVTLDDVVTQISDRACIDDGVIDLNNYLENNETGGNWIITEGNTTLNENLFDPKNVALGNYKFRHTTTSSGCLNTIEVTLEIHNECIVLPCGREDVVISKVITPNGDIYNEFFTITGVETCGFIVELQIFNRWGAKIYDNSNYKNDWNGFVNKSSVGKAGKVPNGTYYYIINLKNSGLEPFAKAFYVGSK